MNGTAGGTSVLRASLVVALGGFLTGFDSAVVSGVVDPVREHFGLDVDRVGWMVSSLTLGAAVAMILAGPIADRFGRRAAMVGTALLFSVSALGCAFADSYWLLVLARIVGGFAVGGALVIAPMWIAEIAPPERRGLLVSCNQLNIVVGLSAAFFSNWFLDRAGLSWRWMLGVEVVPAVAYAALLFTVPHSPRWLVDRGRSEQALAVLERLHGRPAAMAQIAALQHGQRLAAAPGFAELFQPSLRRVVVIGLGLAFFQQATGINAIFYYSPTIFGLAGATRDVALGHAILIGVVNIGFTLVAMRWIDRLGRRPLLLLGSAAMALALVVNGLAFADARYVLTPAVLTAVALTPAEAQALQPLVGVGHHLTQTLAEAIRVQAAGTPSATTLLAKVDALVAGALQVDRWLVLSAILVYIAAFAMSFGPVMWAMFAEIFPRRVRALAISAMSFGNAAVSFAVQQLFPRGLATLGPTAVFFGFAVVAVLACLFTWRLIPETRGRTLEQIERELVGGGAATDP
ncbi:MAG: sugar porter family MFS transporter [Planctomycetes bacterium]|nr:sugar porter family MFS transporter [Planctomycetota bacterium]